MRRIPENRFAGLSLTAVGFALLLALTTLAPAYGQNFEVKGVKGKSKEVILRNTDTGEEWTLRRGEEADGVQVVEVGRDRVTIGQVVEGNVIGVTELPVKQQYRIHRIRPKGVH